MLSEPPTDHYGELVEQEETSEGIRNWRVTNVDRHGHGLPHTVRFFQIYAVKIGHQFRAQGIIRIGQDYISSKYEQVPTRAF